jgi:hypothetical protein
MIRMLAVMVAVAVGIRLIFELLAPVWPYLMVALIVFAVVRIISWYCGRW